MPRTFAGPGLHIDAHLEIDGVLAAMRKLPKFAGIELRDLANEQMKLWVADIIKKTPPPYGNPAQAKGWSRNAREAQHKGERAVEADIRKVFLGINDTVVDTFRIAVDDKEHVTILARDDIAEGAAPQQGKRNSGMVPKGAVYGVATDRWKPNASVGEMAEIHQRFRGSNGRVRIKYERTRHIGRWSFADKLHVRESRLVAYIKEVQGHVGALKGGWVQALRHYSGLVRDSKIASAIPRWISRWAESGDSYGGEISATGSGTIYANNPIGWMHQKMTERFIAQTWRTRELDMLHGARKRLDQLAKRMNSDKAAEGKAA